MDSQAKTDMPQWADSHRILYRGHLGMWHSQFPGNLNHSPWIEPGSIAELYENMSDSSPQADINRLRDEVISHMTTKFQQMSGQIAVWDVVNEPNYGVKNDIYPFAKAFGSLALYTKSMLDIAYENDPFTIRSVNQWGTFEESIWAQNNLGFHAQPSLLSNLLHDLISQGGNVDIIGHQAAFPGRDPDLNAATTNMNYFDEFKLPYMITEFGIMTSNSPDGGAPEIDFTLSESEQADQCKAILEWAFENQRIMGFTFSFFQPFGWGREYWRSILDDDFNPRPAYYSMNQAFDNFYKKLSRPISEAQWALTIRGNNYKNSDGERDIVILDESDHTKPNTITFPLTLRYKRDIRLGLIAKNTGYDPGPEVEVKLNHMQDPIGTLRFNHGDNEYSTEYLDVMGLDKGSYLVAFTFKNQANPVPAAEYGRRLLVDEMSMSPLRYEAEDTSSISTGAAYSECDQDTGLYINNGYALTQQGQFSEYDICIDSLDTMILSVYAKADAEQCRDAIVKYDGSDIGTLNWSQGVNRMGFASINLPKSTYGVHKLRIENGNQSQSGDSNGIFIDYFTVSPSTDKIQAEAWTDKDGIWTSNIYNQDMSTLMIRQQNAYAIYDVNIKKSDFKFIMRARHDIPGPVDAQISLITDAGEQVMGTLTYEKNDNSFGTKVLSLTDKPLGWCKIKIELLNDPDNFRQPDDPWTENTDRALEVDWHEIKY